MKQEELNRTLLEVHQALEETSDVDPQTQELLVSVLGDIQRVLSKGSNTDGNDETDASLSERLEDAMREFGANHPILGGLLGRLSDGLANMGI